MGGQLIRHMLAMVVELYIVDLDVIMYVFVFHHAKFLLYTCVPLRHFFLLCDV